MLRLKPILLFCSAFSFGAALVIYVFLTSSPSNTYILLWLPFVGSFFGFLAILIRQMNPLWRGISFVIFIIGCFIFYSSEKNLEASKNPLSSPDKLEKIFETFHLYQKRKILANLAANPQTPAAILMELSRKNNELILSRLGANPSATEDMLTPLMQLKPSPYSHGGLAANPRIANQMIDYLIHVQPSDFKNSEEWNLYKTDVLAVLLKNPALSEEQAQKAASHLEGQH